MTKLYSVHKCKLTGGGHLFIVHRTKPIKLRGELGKISPYIMKFGRNKEINDLKFQKCKMDRLWPFCKPSW